MPGEPEGTYRLESDPEQVVYVPVETLEDGTTIIPAQEPSGDVETVDGQQVTKLYGTQLGSNYVEDPVLGMVRFLPDNVSWLKWVLGPWVGILAATILFIATNAGIIGVSRLAFSLGQHRQLPRVLGRVHPTRLTPYVAIAVFGVIAVILILPGEITLLADLYAFGSMISFTAAHVSVIMLRYREPDLVRPFRAPLNVRIAGTYVPMTAVLGAMGTFAVWCVIMYYKPVSGVVGLAWVAVGLVVYVIFRKAQGYSLTKTVKSPTLPASLQEDVVYDQLLVPVRDTQVSDEMMVLACQLATERKSSIDALYVIEVPLNLPIDASLPEERERARQVLERTHERGGPVQRPGDADRRHGALGGPGDRRRGHRPPLRGHRPRLAGQAAHRRQGVRPHHRLRAQQPALRGDHQRDPQDARHGERGVGRRRRLSHHDPAACRAPGVGRLRVRRRRAEAQPATSPAARGGVEAQGAGPAAEQVPALAAGPERVGPSSGSRRRRPRSLRPSRRRHAMPAGVTRPPTEPAG